MTISWLPMGKRCVPARRLRKSENRNIHLKFLRVRFSGLGIKVCRFISRAYPRKALLRSRKGVGGILISTAKSVLTTLCAGIHPYRTLSVVLDCGTDVRYPLGVINLNDLYYEQNQQLLLDELYLGLRQPRVRGRTYDDFVENFVQAARKLYPRAYIHL